MTPGAILVVVLIIIGVAAIIQRGQEKQRAEAAGDAALVLREHFDDIGISRLGELQWQ